MYDCAEVLNVNWWDAVTAIGVDAYYPLVDLPVPNPRPPDFPRPIDFRNAPLPSVERLVAGWRDDAQTSETNFSQRQNRFIAPVNSLRALSAVHGGQKILITEIGYQSQRGTTAQPFGIFLDPEQPYYAAEQERAYTAAFEAFLGEPWLLGMFWWAVVVPEYEPEADNNYLFFGKPAGNVLRSYYGPRPNAAPPRRP